MFKGIFAQKYDILYSIWHHLEPESVYIFTSYYFVKLPDSLTVLELGEKITAECRILKNFTQKNDGFKIL
jgi:hypothetical protein